jgi:hypothetical protein
MVLQEGQAEVCPSRSARPHNPQQRRIGKDLEGRSLSCLLKVLSQHMPELLMKPTKYLSQETSVVGLVSQGPEQEAGVQIAQPQLCVWSCC